jgi:hypothetical protein
VFESLKRDDLSSNAPKHFPATPGHRFQCHVATGLSVFGEMYDSHRPLTESGDDSVGADLEILTNWHVQIVARR